MESDEVNSISDTVESYALAVLLRSVYYDLSIDLALPEHETLFQLDPSGDATKPVLMTIPENVALVRNIKYNIQTATETRPNYRDLIFKPFMEFMMDQNNLHGNTTHVDQMSFTQDAESFVLVYSTNAAPRYFTTMDDFTFLFDSYDNTLDTTLQKAKTLCMGVIYPPFSLTDNFTPDLDPSQFSLLKNRAKVRAFAELKQAPNQEAASEARRQKIIVQKRKRSTPDLAPIFNLPTRYGRRDGFSRNAPIPKTLKQSW